MKRKLSKRLPSLSKRAMDKLAVDVPKKMIDDIIQWIRNRDEAEIANNFDIDISDTKQYQNLDWLQQGIDKLKNEYGFDKLHVILLDVGHAGKPGYSAANQEHGPTLVLPPSYLKNSDPKLRRILAHELSHMMQHLMSKSQKIKNGEDIFEPKEEDPFFDRSISPVTHGLPGKRDKLTLKRPFYYSDPVEHTLSDMEFYPKLNDAKNQMRDYLLAPYSWGGAEAYPDVFGAPDFLGFEDLPPERKEQLVRSRFKQFINNNLFLKVLHTFGEDPERYQKALGILTKEFNNILDGILKEKQLSQRSWRQHQVQQMHNTEPQIGDILGVFNEEEPMSTKASRHLSKRAGEFDDTLRDIYRDVFNVDVDDPKQSIEAPWLFEEVQRPVSGDEPQAEIEEETKPDSLEEFSKVVQQVVNSMDDSGRFGSRKVFISAAYNAAKPMLPEMSIDEFKRTLIEANRRDLLALHRADLVGAMDPKMVQDSETTEDLGFTKAQFHFIEIRPIQTRKAHMLLSKRAKVTSDKPAYKEKKKTDKGYVWVYDEKHVEKRWKEKKEKIKKLEKELKKVREQYQKDLTSDNERARAIAAIVGIMDDTAMRIGNEESAKEGTYGASTLKVKHVKGGKGNMTFDFPGKGAVEQNVVLKNNKVIKVVRDLMKGKKKDDFIFEVDGKKIWDRAVNRYLSSFDISAKDLRGFHANRLMKDMLKKKDFDEALKEVAEIVGHEQATLKNQYLDPELVEKHSGKQEKKAALSSRAAGETTEPMPEITQENPYEDIKQPIIVNDPMSLTNMAKMVNTNLNINNAGDDVVFRDPSIQNAWRIVAPFLPAGAKITSAFRDDFEQARFFIQKWRSWAGKWAPRRGIFAKNHPEFNKFVDRIQGKIENQIPFSDRDYMVFDKMQQIMQSELPEGMSDYAVATPGSSYHAQDAAFDISGAALSDVIEALQHVESALPQSIQIKRILEEPPPQKAVHVVLDRAVTVPTMEQYVPVLYEFLKSKNRLAYNAKQGTNKPILSKRAKLTPEDAQWVQSIKPQLSQRVGPRPIPQAGNTIQMQKETKRMMGMRPGCKVNDLILAGWRSLQPFLPRGSVMTSGFRTPEDQKRIINNYWKRATGRPIPEHLRHDDRVWRQASRILTKQYGYIVGPPWTKNPYAHLKGTAFDVSGPDLHGIVEAVRMVSGDNRIPVKFRKPLLENKNRCVHIGIEHASYDPQAIRAVLNEQGRRFASISKRASEETEEFELITELHDAFAISNPDKLDEFEEAMGLEHKCAFDFFEDMGFGAEDLPGDWFEKSPIFRWRDEEDVPEYDIHEVSESEAKRIADDEPEKFFYRGLHKEYPDLESEALKHMIKTNAKFFFIFNYHEREEKEFQDLIEEAAELLSQQEVRAFFYYHLHHKFPELGRGAIIQLIDTNPDSFFDLGLQKDYPDLEESAGAARNIKDPNKVELEQPEWMKNEPDKPISVRDKNASWSLSKRAEDDDGSKYEKEKGDPKWDEILIDKDRKWTRREIRNHYLKHKGKILKEIKDKPVMLYIGTGKNENVLKRNHNDKRIVISDEKDLMYWADRRMVSIHRVIEAQTNLAFVDLDVHGSFSDDKVKQYARKIASKIKSKYVSSPTIYDSGGTGYHVEFALGEKKSADTLRNELRELCEDLNEEFEGFTTGLVKGDGVRTDTTTLKTNGNLRVPYALHEKYGGVKKPLGGGDDSNDGVPLISARDTLTASKIRKKLHKYAEDWAQYYTQRQNQMKMWKRTTEELNTKYQQAHANYIINYFALQAIELIGPQQNADVNVLLDKYLLKELDLQISGLDRSGEHLAADIVESHKYELAEDIKKIVQEERAKKAQVKTLSKRAAEDALSLYEDLANENLLSAKELIKIHELEYKISRLYADDPTSYELRRIDYMTKELSKLLEKAIEAMTKIYRWWAHLHYGEFSETRVSMEAMEEEIYRNYPDLAEELLDDLSDWYIGFRTNSDRWLNDISNELKKKLFEQDQGPFKNIMSRLAELSKGATGDVSRDSQLFNHALRTMHQGGPMMSHLAGVTDISEQLLSDLTAGKFTKQWDKEIGKDPVQASHIMTRSVRAISKRSGNGFSKQDLIDLYKFKYLRDKHMRSSDEQSMKTVKYLDAMFKDRLYYIFSVAEKVFAQWLYEHKAKFGDLSNPKEFNDTVEWQLYTLLQNNPEAQDDEKLQAYKEQAVRNVSRWRKTFEMIQALHKELQAGPKDSMESNFELLNHVVGTAHIRGDMLEYLAQTEDDEEQRITPELMSQLNAGDPELIRGWEREYRKMSSEKQLSKRAEVNDSAGVFALLPADIAKQFKSLGDHDDSKPHVTVLYVGKVPKGKRKLLQETVEKVINNWNPFEAKLDKNVSYFPATKHSDNCKIAKMKVLSKQLHKLHKELKEAVKEAGIKIDDHFPAYKPHVTLEYMEPPKESYTDDVPTGSWTIDCVEIWGIGKNKPIKFCKKISKRSQNKGISFPSGEHSDLLERSLSKRAGDPLSSYKKKRDFNETSEPEGKKSDKNQYRFVIQRHKAKKVGEHFDLRLENDKGTMSSWAVPKHKLPSKGEKLLATKTEDHPIEYMKFKGELPEGEYGAGKVEIYDSGKYEEIEKSANKIVFKLRGAKAKGTYVLVKTDGKKWLLMQSKEDHDD